MLKRNREDKEGKEQEKKEEEETKKQAIKYKSLYVGVLVDFANEDFESIAQWVEDAKKQKLIGTCSGCTRVRDTDDLDCCEYCGEKELDEDIIDQKE